MALYLRAEVVLIFVGPVLLPTPLISWPYKLTRLD